MCSYGSVKTNKRWSTMLHLQGVTVTARDDTLVPELKMSLMMDETFLYTK